ncbi:MAG: hypothetical protein Q8P41_27365 [Pseudomonadota bacterium]|nr:hypothetical protein [Pseudomonadota bacterium]
MLRTGDSYWDAPAGGSNHGALYVFEGAPTGVVSLADADLRVYGEVADASLGFEKVLADGRVLAVAEYEATAGGEGVAYLLEL